METFSFKCPYCKNLNKALSSEAGSDKNCDHCEKRYIVPRHKKLALKGELATAIKIDDQNQQSSTIDARSGPKISTLGKTETSTFSEQQKDSYQESKNSPSVNVAKNTSNWFKVLASGITVCLAIVLIGFLGYTYYLRTSQASTSPQEAKPSTEIIYNLVDSITLSMQRAENSYEIMENDKLTLEQLKLINQDGKLNDQAHILESSIKKRKSTIERNLSDAIEKTMTLVEYHNKWASYTSNAMEEKLLHLQQASNSSAIWSETIYQIVMESPSDTAEAKEFLKSKIQL